MMRGAVLGGLALTAAFVAAGEPARAGARRAMQDVEYEIRVVDNPAERRFDLTLVAKGEADFCVTDSQWPRRGFIMFASDLVAVEVDGRRFPAIDLNGGYPTEPRVIYRATAAKPVTAFISYDLFPKEAFEATGPRTLKYRPVILHCTWKQRRRVLVQRDEP